MHHLVMGQICHGLSMSAQPSPPVVEKEEEKYIFLVIFFLSDSLCSLLLLVLPRDDLPAPPRPCLLLLLPGRCLPADPPRRAPLAANRPSPPRRAMPRAGAEPGVPLLREGTGVQGDARIVGRTRTRRRRGGGGAGGRAAGDLPAHRGQPRRAGDHQAVPHPGTASRALVGSSRLWPDFL
jgi:hypothetical protein